MKPHAQTMHFEPDALDIPEAGYHEALAKALAEGRAQLDAGEGIPLEEVEKEFGLE